MKKAGPHIVSVLLTLSALVATMPSALAQQSLDDQSDDGMFVSAARSFSNSVGQWFGFNDPSPAAVDAAQINDINRISDNVDAPELLLEAFPALSSADDVMHSLDFSREQKFLETGAGAPQELDLNASYIWESPRFGQFILSTNTTYVYNSGHADVARESAGSLTASEKSAAGFGLSTGMSAGLAPELQSSLTFTWQIGNHTATAVTSYVDGLETFGKLGNDALNIEQLNELMGEIATLDLSYGYNVKAGRQGNASISVGLRSQFDRRQLAPAINPATSRLLNIPERMAYGTIKYQF